MKRVREDGETDFRKMTEYKLVVVGGEYAPVKHITNFVGICL